LSADKTIQAHYIVFSQDPASTGKVYLKNVKGGQAVLIRAFIPPGTTGFLDEHRLDGDSQANPLYPADWAVDAANTGDGMIVYWVSE
jgi:hypothetical protein